MAHVIPFAVLGAPRAAFARGVLPDPALFSATLRVLGASGLPFHSPFLYFPFSNFYFLFSETQNLQLMIEYYFFPSSSQISSEICCAFVVTSHLPFRARSNG